MKQIPNLFTLLNLFFGCCAVVFVLENGLIVNYGADDSPYLDVPEKIWMASLFIGLAALVDFLDGFIARLFKASSALGKELDSLADVVSFGVAPGMILYHFLRMSYAQEQAGLDISFVFLLPAFLFPCAAAFRLAKFNLDESQAYGFKGVPTPAAGLLVASFPLIYFYSHSALLTNILLNRWALYALILLLSYLMVSNIPLMALKFRDRTLKGNLPKILLVGVALIAALFFKWFAVPVTFIAYILLSLLFKNQNK
jgi:CDP-diacylglycerol---serine O-phosphatidyltransferase